MLTKPSRFTEEQIIGILREQEAGTPTTDVCRKHGISSATFYKWKGKYVGLEVFDAKRLRALEDENAKLKKLLAEAMLDNAMLKEVLSKNGDARREARGRRSPAEHLRSERAAGVRSPEGRSDLGPLSQPSAGRRARADTPARTGGRPPPVRLSPPASSKRKARGRW
jgi:putative transposase